MSTISIRKLLCLALIPLALLAACAGDESEEVTTSSDLALECYLDGTAAMERFLLEKGRDCFVKALDEDPEFSMAWAHLSIAQRQLGEIEAAKESIQRAWETRELASEVEALWVTRLHAIFERDQATAETAYQTMLERYPDHPWVLRLRAEYAKLQNDYDTALACYDRLL